MSTRRSILQGMVGGAAYLSVGAVRAKTDQTPITLLVGAASSMDFTARLVAEQLRTHLNRPVVVVSKLGAGGRVALGELKRAEADGRTLMFSTSSAFVIYPNIYTELNYDPVADFTPIGCVSWFDVGVATGPATKAGNMAELIQWAKGRNESVSYGAAPGAGSSSHFAGIAVALETGIPMTPVQYKDSAIGIVDLSTGRIPIMITGTSPLVEMHKSGRIKLLAVSGEQRSALAPDVPTLREAGLDIAIQNSAGLYGPANLAPDLVEMFYEAMQPMFDKPKVLEQLASQGMAPSPMTASELAASLETGRRDFKRLVEASGYQPTAL